MKAVVLIVVIPIAFMFSIMGWLILKNKIDFKENGMEYIGNKVSVDMAVMLKSTGKDNRIRKASGVVLLICGIFMVLLPAIIL